jgi:hypothetical protein
MIKRAVYSLWTKPMNGKTVGFNTEKNLIDCFALSLHYTKKWFDEVHLVTDFEGKDLVERYGLSFDNIDTSLEHVMMGIYENHWSLGKIYACKLQKEPFIHIDIDVILFKPLPDKFLKSDAAFQNLETESQKYWYKWLLDHAEKNYVSKPKWFDTEKVKAYNCGVIAFNKLDVIQEWWTESLNYIKFLDESKFNYDHHLSCLIYEQFCIYCICKFYNYEVDLLTFYGESHEKYMGTISEELAKKLGYTHLIAASKRDPLIEKKIKNRLLEEGITIKKNNKDLSIY